MTMLYYISLILLTYKTILLSYFTIYYSLVFYSYLFPIRNVIFILQTVLDIITSLCLYYLKIVILNMTFIHTKTWIFHKYTSISIDNLYHI